MKVILLKIIGFLICLNVLPVLIGSITYHYNDDFWVGYTDALCTIAVIGVAVGLFAVGVIMMNVRSAD